MGRVSEWCMLGLLVPLLRHADTFTTTTPSTVTPTPDSGFIELTGNNGSFTSQYPGNYSDNTETLWRVTAVDSDGAVSIDFTQFSTEQCCDKVYLYDGNSTKAPVIQTLSGQLAPPTQSYNSTQRYMCIRFVTDETIADTGFSATYTSLPGSGNSAGPDACSPDSRPLQLTGLYGLLSSPNYPASYPNNADCRWLITAVDANDTVAIEFTQLSTEQCCDFIYLYDGDSAKATELATLSGQLAPPPERYVSTQRYMFIRFTSDDTDTDVGFNATFATIPAARPPGDPCSITSRPMQLTGHSGVFTSPNYPDVYQNNAECQWLITAMLPNETVLLDLVHFSTEECCDKLLIFDGNSTKAPRLATLGGQLAPPTLSFNTSQQFMFLLLLTDNVVGYAGFNATYTSVSPSPGPADPCSPEDRPVDLTGYFGSFESNNYQGLYPNNADCQWRLTAVELDAVVTLTISRFSTEQCCDELFIYDGDSTKAPLIAALSGQMAPPPRIYVSTQRYMFVRFTSDYSGTDIGFSATYSSPTSPCSPTDRPLRLTGVSGTLASTNYPAAYENDADCQWLITSVFQFVELNFASFSTESCCDLVYIRDGNDAKSPLIATLSGSPPTSTGPFVTTQAYMLVRFTTDAVNVDTGFSATYTSISAPETTAATATPTTTSAEEQTTSGYY